MMLLALYFIFNFCFHVGKAQKETNSELLQIFEDYAKWVNHTWPELGLPNMSITAIKKIHTQCEAFINTASDIDQSSLSSDDKKYLDLFKVFFLSKGMNAVGPNITRDKTYSSSTPTS